LSAGCRVRSGTRGDLAALPAIARDAAQAFAGIGWNGAVDPPLRAPGEFRRGLESGALLVAEVAGRQVGFALAWTVDGHAHLAELAVRRDRQRRGAGRRLLGAVERWARRTRRGCITLVTFRDVPWNAPFYARLGYVPHVPGADEPELRRLVDGDVPGGGDARGRLVMRKRL
jgi:GNAT superfamily N-acetyltransferase